MSWTRAILLAVLVVLLGGVITIGCFQWLKSYPSYYYSRAERAVEREDFESAKLHLLRLVVKHPTHAEGHEFLSRVILDEARAANRPASYVANPAAIAHLAKAVELRPRETQWRRRLLRAYLQTRQIIPAAEVAETIYAEDKTDGDAHLALTWRAVSAKDVEATERLFAESANVVSRHVFHEYMLKLTHYSSIPTAENIEVYRKTLVEGVNLASELSEEDMRLLTYRDREVMLQVLLRAQLQVRTPSDKTRIANLIIDVCEKLQRAELLDKQVIATAASQSQHILNSDSSSSVLTDSHRTARNQVIDRGSDLVASAVDVEDEDQGEQSPIIVYRTNALTLLRNGKPDEALQMLKRGAAAAEEMGSAADGQRMQLLLLSARILINLQRFDEANEQLELLSGSQYEGWRHLLHGEMAMRAENYAEAESELLLAQRKLNSDSLELHHALAIAYIMQQKWEEAIPHLEAALAPEEELSPYDRAWRQKRGFVGSVHLELLRARLRIGQWDEAQQNLAALRDTELAPRAWEEAIHYLRENKQAGKAWKYLRLVRHKYPQNIEFMFLQCDMLEAEGKLDQAVLEFKDYVALRQHDPVRPLAMAHWLLARGKSKEALSALKGMPAGITLTPRDRNTLDLLTVKAHLRLGEFDQAQSIIEALIANADTKPAGHLFHSIVASTQGDEQLAEQHVAKALLANAEQMEEDRSVVNIRRPNGHVVGAVVRNVYVW